MEGYVQMHRKMMDSVIFQNLYYLKLWVYLMFKARYTPGEVMVGQTIVKLEVGQLIWGRNEAARKLNEGLIGKQVKDPTTWENYLKKIELMGKVHREVHSKFTVVTLVNYEYYQDTTNKFSHENAPILHSNFADSSQILPTKNKDNNINKDNKVLGSSSPTDNKNNTNVDEEFRNVHEEMQQNFGRPLSPIEQETVGAWLTEDKYEPDVIRVALSEAVLNHAYSLKYMDKILLTWERKGIRSKSEALANIQKRRNERSVSQPKEPIEPEELPEVPMYDWVNQDKEPIQ